MFKYKIFNTIKKKILLILQDRNIVLIKYDFGQ